MSQHPANSSSLESRRGRFLQRIREPLDEALAIRQAAPIPQISWLTALLIVLVAAYIAIAIVDVPRGEARVYNFYDERGSVTALSAIFLAMGCGFAFAAFFVSNAASRRLRVFWLLMTVALGFLAVDELVGFHERAGFILDRLAVTGEVARKGNDLVVIAYGVIALPLMMYFLPTLLRFRRFPELLGVAFALFAVHTFIDSTQEPPTTFSIIAEESAKLYCSMFLALAFFSGLLGSIETRRSPRFEQQ